MHMITGNGVVRRDPSEPVESKLQSCKICVVATSNECLSLQLNDPQARLCSLAMRQFFRESAVLQVDGSRTL